jgi:hypothetical protein
MSRQIRPSQPDPVFLADFLRLAPELLFAGFLFTAFLFNGFLPIVFFFLALISENTLSPGDITRPIDHNDGISSRSNLPGPKCSVSSRAL